MVLHIIGIGLHDEKDITLRGLEIVKSCEEVFLEGYTAILQCPVEKLEELYGKNVVLADRNLVEKNADRILENAKDSDVAFLVVGDPMGATTHIDLVLRAKAKGIDVKVAHNSSILTSIGVIGLELYKYGKTTSIVFPDPEWKVTAHYDVIKQNKAAGLHTLCLLDIKTAEPSKDDLIKDSGGGVQPSRFMTVAQAIESLLSVEKERGECVFTEDTLCVGCARISSPDQDIVSGSATDVLAVDMGGPMHCLIVPGNLHFMEEDALKMWKR